MDDERQSRKLRQLQAEMIALANDREKATSADACVELGFGRDRVFAPAKPGLAGWAGAVRDAVAALA